MPAVSLIHIVLMTFACIQYSEAWLHSWSSGSHTITGDVSGMPGVTSDWSAGVTWTYRFSRTVDLLQTCSHVADAIVTREQWKAMTPRQQLTITDRANQVYVWHTGPNTCKLIGLTEVKCQDCLQQKSCKQRIVRAIQDGDLKQGKDDIRYNFLIDEEGVIYEGRGFGVTGQHTIGKNSKSIGVALIGDFSKTEPSEAAQDALNTLIVCGKETDELTADVKMTSGPQMAGKAFYDMLTRCNGLCL